MMLNKWYLDFHSGDETGFYYIMSLHMWGGRIFKLGASGLYHLSREEEIRSFKFSRIKSESLHSLNISASSLDINLKKAHLCTRHGSTGIEGEWERLAPPARRLFKPFFQKEKHWCDWKVWMPFAKVRLTIKNGDKVKNLQGKGYMDFVRFAFPPWKIPFNTLYWGRLHSDNHWIVLALVQSKNGRKAVYYEPGHTGSEASVEVKKDTGGKIRQFNWSLESAGKKQICAEVVRTLEVQEVMDRAILSRLPGPTRRLLGASGVDKKFEVCAQLDGILYQGIMEEVTWNEKPW